MSTSGSWRARYAAVSRLYAISIILYPSGAIRPAPPPGRNSVEPLDIPPAEEIAAIAPDGRQPARADRRAQPGRGAIHDQGCFPDGQRIAGLVEVAVMAQVAVIDGSAVDGEAGRSVGTGLAKDSRALARVVRLSARGPAENLVRPGDRLESALVGVIRGGRVRVVAPGQPPIGGLDLGGRRRPGDTERPVVVGPSRVASSWCLPRAGPDRRGFSWPAGPSRSSGRSPGPDAPRAG